MPRKPDPNVRDALLRAARQELRTRGATALRVEDLARAAGVSKGAFYLHFPTKEALFDELVARFVGAIEDHATRRHEDERLLLGSVNADLAVAAEALVSFHTERDVELLDTFWRHRDVLALAAGPDGGVRSPLVAALRRKVEEQCLAAFRVGQAAGRVRPGLDPAALTDLVVGAWDNLARRLPSLRDKPDFTAWARTISQVLWFGLLPNRTEHP